MDATRRPVTEVERAIQAHTRAIARLIRCLKHPDEVWCVAVSADGKTLLTGGKDGAVRLWETRTGDLLATLAGQAHGVRALALSPCGRTLATGGPDRTVRLWHYQSGQELLAFGPLEHEVNGLAFSADGQRLAAALHDGGVRLWHAPAAGTGEP